MPESQIDAGWGPVEIEGASKLIDVYGYWISFHDASIESVLIERKGPSVTIHFETCDEADGGDENQEAIVVVRWDGVEELILSGVDHEEKNWINELSIAPCGDRIQCILTRMYGGTHGLIIARRMTVLDVRPQ